MVQGLWQPYQPQTYGSSAGAAGPALPMRASAPAPADVTGEAAAAKTDNSPADIKEASIAIQAAAPAADAPALPIPSAAPFGSLTQVGSLSQHPIMSA